MVFSTFGKPSLEFGRLYPNIDETTTKNSTKERDYGKEKRSASSSRWLNEHFKDPFVQKAHKQKLRSRAYFKLDEIQQTDKLFKPGMTVVDLGAAPGGWSQYVVSQIGGKGRVIACDILDMNPIVGVDFLQGDFRDENVLNALLERVGEAKLM